MSFIYLFILQFFIISSTLLFFSDGYFLILKFNSKQYLNLSSIVGYSILIIEINFLYFALKLNSQTILYLIFTISSLLLFFNLYNYKFKFIKDFFNSFLISIPNHICFDYLIPNLW